MEKATDTSSSQSLPNTEAAQLNGEQSAATSTLTTAASLQLIVEMEVEQLELEMNKEALLLSLPKENIGEASFELSTKACFKISPQGYIINLTVSAAKLLGKDESAVQLVLFTNFLSAATQPIFTAFLQQLFSTKGKQNCQVELLSQNNTAHQLTLNGMVGKDESFGMLEVVEVKKAQLEDKLLLDQYILLAAIIESNTDAIFSLDKDYRYTSFNKAHADRMKLIYGAAIEIGKVMLDYQTVPADSAKAKKNFDRALNGEYFIVHTFSGEEGLQRNFYEISHYPIYATDKTVIGVSVFSRDLTNLVQAEQALSSQQYFFEQMFMQSSVSTQILDKDGWCQRINPKLSEIFGVQPAHIEGKLYNIFEDDAVKQSGIIPQLTAVFKEGKALEWEVLFDIGLAAEGQQIEVKEKKKVWYHCNAYPIFDKDGEVSNVVIQHTDITGKKLSEVAIQQSNERFNLVAKATNDAIWDWDLTTNNVLRTGEGFKALFGYENEEADSDNTFWIKKVHPDDIEKLFKNRKKTFDDPTAIYWEDEYRFKKSNGFYATVYDKGYIIRDAAGKAIRIIGATQNITKLRENEYRLAELNESLQNQAKELADSNMELEQFAYVASHDLQEPLRMITGFLGLIEKKYADSLDEAGKNYIDFAVNGAERMRYLILDLLEYSRVGKMEIEGENLDLNELVTEIKLLLSSQILEKNATFQVSNLPTIHAERAPLLQVFTNLIGNALKYSRKDVPVQITINAKDLSEYWQFEIADNGLGIDKKYFDKIFVIFRRLHNRDEFSGNGIGLAITKKVIEKQGGKIWLTSEQGKGSTFYFTIKK